MSELTRIDPYRLRLPREGDMRVDATVFATEAIKIEPDSLKQLADAARMPSVEVALATPDIHVGYGVPIGCVMATREVVSPAAVGYDINCGMRLLTTPLEAADVDFRELARSIRRDVPLGEGKTNLRLRPDQFEHVIEKGLAGLAELEGGLGRYGEIRRPEDETADAPRAEDSGSEPGRADACSERALGRGRNQLGTIGGGNHFIELQEVDRVEDEEAARRFGVGRGRFVFMIHTGSRGFGHQIAGDYMKLSKKLHRKESPSPHLTFLRADEEGGRRYLGAMFAAANFAFANRQIITAYVRRALRSVYGDDLELPLVYDVTHNMVKREIHGGRELWVHRKGATRAFPPERMAGTPFAETGQPVLIPGSMGTASYLLLAGEGGAEALWSVNHGAGRVMSRTAAAGRRTRKGKVLKPGLVTREAFDSAMEGIVLVAEDRSAVFEEAPQAYKDIDEVIEAVRGAGLARVVCRMRPRAVLKG
jgi:tRNA-splicing ligase RtcB